MVIFGVHCSHVKKRALLWLCLNSWIKMGNRLSSSVSVASGLAGNLSLNWIRSPTAGAVHPQKFRKHKTLCLNVRLKAEKKSCPSLEKWLRYFLGAMLSGSRMLKLLLIVNTYLHLNRLQSGLCSFLLSDRHRHVKSQSSCQADYRYFIGL